MSREDLFNLAFFTIVPPLALLLFALTIVAIAALPRGRREGFIVCAAVFTAVGLVGVVIAAWMWELGFDYADDSIPVKEAIDSSMDFGFFVAFTSYAGVLATGLLATRRRRVSQSTRPRSTSARLRRVRNSA